MSIGFLNRAKMTSATTGTGTLTLGAAASGFQTFAAAGAVNAGVYRYVIEDGTVWEVGLGTYTSSGTTLSRTLIESSTGSLINCSGSQTVAIIAAAQDVAAQVLLSEVVTSSSAASVSFSSISQNYRDLEIRVRGRCDAAGGNKDRTLRLQFNGDSGSNYEYTTAYIQNGAAGAGTSGPATTHLDVGLLPSGAATASYSGICTVTIADYTGTTFFKAVCGHGGEMKSTSAADQNAQISGGLWLSTAAINAIVVSFDSGNFVDGSVVSLYGRR